MNDDFSLIETILLESQAFFLLDLHLDRIKKSAKFFAFKCDIPDMKKKLDNLKKTLANNESYRVRILLDRSGNVNVQHEKLTPLCEYPVRTALSDKRTDKTNLFYGHKTTKRSLYDDELKKARQKGLFDVIFLNRNGELTEGAISNVILFRNEKYYTPPLSSGLLPGIYRKSLIEVKKLPLIEKVLHKEDIKTAEKIFLVNSVRKIVPAILIQ